MQRALQLATYGGRAAAPNPQVGCVFTQNHQIVAEGWHQAFGESHAEIHALRSLAASTHLHKATLYLTLEPCTHYGKTPPCADKLVDIGIKKAHIATEDPNSMVRGKGIKKLVDAGIEVHTGLLEQQAQWLNRRFFTYHTKRRPYIILKWAQSTDGFIAPTHKPYWLSNRSAAYLTHKWRSEEQAILVGYRTIVEDNALLNVRYLRDKHSPLRVVVDKYASLPRHLNIFNAHLAPTVLYTKAAHQSLPYQRLSSLHISNILEDLYKKQVLSILVEGGAATLQTFLEASCWDEIRVFHTSPVLKKGLLAPHTPLSAVLIQTLALHDNILRVYRRNKSL